MLQTMNKKGQLIGAVSALVVTAILLVIGILVFSQVDNSVDQSGFTAAQNMTIDNVGTTALDAFELATIGLIVLAAAAILAILIRGFRGG